MTEANIETVVDVNEVTLYIYSEFTPEGGGVLEEMVVQSFLLEEESQYHLILNLILI